MDAQGGACVPHAPPRSANDIDMIIEHATKDELDDLGIAWGKRKVNRQIQELVLDQILVTVSIIVLHKMFTLVSHFTFY